MSPAQEPAEAGPGHDEVRNRLVTEARSGSVAAQEALYQALAGGLSAYIVSRAGAQVMRVASVDDLCQETFLGAFESIGVLAPGADFNAFRGLVFRHAGWVIGKTLRKLERQLGESAIGEPLDVAMHQAGHSRSAGSVTRADGNRWLSTMIERLDAGQAQVLQRRMQGFSFEEIAKALGITQEAARKRYLRGSKQLRVLIEGS